MPHLTSSPDSLVQSSLLVKQELPLWSLFSSLGHGLEIYKLFVVESGAGVLDKLRIRASPREGFLETSYPSKLAPDREVKDRTGKAVAEGVRTPNILAVGDNLFSFWPFLWPGAS